MKTNLLVLSMFLAMGFTNTAFSTPVWISTAWPEFVGVAKVARDFADTLKAESNIELKFAWNNSRASDSDAQQAVRDGRIDGMILTGQELSAILPEVRQSEAPLLYASHRQNLDQWIQMNKSAWIKTAKSKGLMLLAVFDSGGIFLATRENFSTIKDLAGRKMWSRPEDPLLAELIAGIHGVPVSLPIPAVSEAFSHDQVQVVWGPSAAYMGLQWSAGAKFILDKPVSVIVGALFVRQSTWDAWTAVNRTFVGTLAKKLEQNVTHASRDDEEHFLATMKSTKSIAVKTLTKDDEHYAATLRQKLHK